MFWSMVIHIVSSFSSNKKFLASKQEFMQCKGTLYYKEIERWLYNIYGFIGCHISPKHCCLAGGYHGADEHKVPNWTSGAAGCKQKAEELMSTK